MDQSIKKKFSHALFSPSKAHQWLYCPLSLQLEKKANIIDPPPSQEAMDGTEAHKKLASILNNHYYLSYNNSVPDISDSLVNISSSFIINTYPKSSYRVLSEQSLILNEDVAGTPDVVVLDKDPIDNNFKVKAIIDFKYGDSEVEAYNNSQLLMYAYLTSKLIGNLEEVDLIILQPKIENCSVKIWTVGETQLKVFEEQLNQAMNYYYGKDTLHRGFPVKQTEDVCKYCKVRYTHCPYTISAVESVQKSVVKLEDPTKIVLTKEQEIFLLKHRTKIINYLDKLHEVYKKRIKDGESIEGLKLTKDKVYKSWDLDFKKEIESLLNLNSINPYTTSMKTPAQVLKENKELNLEGLIKTEKRGSYIVEGE